ncbi:MAG: hypothetical protein KatS3mg008_1343 [Acidimicrobiales bacterium]|nr:MAG: hypothetical protein KatS3mg008_1343 [Acidimicrobiales bacterium]
MGVGRGHPEWVFSRKLRVSGIAWVLVTVPLVTFLGNSVSGRREYVAAWVLVSALYTTPALVNTWMAKHRTVREDRPFWRLVFAGLVAVYVVGAALLAFAIFDVVPPVWLAVSGVVPPVLLLGTANVQIVRSRSGARLLLIDVIETAIVITAVVAPILLLGSDVLLSGREAWWTIPSALTAWCLLTAAAWTLLLFARIGGAPRTVEGLATCAAIAGALDAAANVAQGTSGFSLPAGPLLGMQAATLGLVQITPLFLTRKPPAGLDRLPPQRQVRSGVAVSVVMVVSAPLLVVLGLTVSQSVPWGPSYVAAVLALLSVLGAVRHLLTLRETRSLYRRVEDAAAERRLLLAQLLRAMEEDRRKVAAQLHAQAAGSYAAFTSLVHAGERIGAPTGGTLATAGRWLRKDLEDRAEALRRLSLAVGPLDEVGPSSKETCEAVIRGYVEALWGDARTPVLEISVDERLSLDWTTSTVLLRILQEAIHNVWEHADARNLHIEVRWLPDTGLRASVSDDGRGFDPSTVSTRRGLAVVELLAHALDADFELESRPGSGSRLSVVVPMGASRNHTPLGPDPLTSSRPSRTRS